MTALVWDQSGERLYETGVDHGVLYIPTAGVYDLGVAWNGLTTVTESPSGAEATALYADNIKYLNLISVEEFGGTIEAYTYPNEFAQCDGTEEPVPGVLVAQQTRKTFGLSYRTRLGNDEESTDYGYKLHLVYNAIAAPSEKAFATINDSPEAITFSWEFSTTGVAVPNLKPSALITIVSTDVDSDDLDALLQVLYGTVGTSPRLPLPQELLGMFAAGATVEVMPVAPTYVDATDTLTIPAVTGVSYYIDNVLVAAGPIVITQDTVVTARPNSGYTFPAVADEDWFFNHKP